jgi:hypothetical protein
VRNVCLRSSTSGSARQIRRTSSQLAMRAG